MARQTISAEIRGHVFMIRADWSDPESPVEIENQGYGWELTGDLVAEYLRDITSPADLALRAVVATIQCHFDDCDSEDLSPLKILSAAVLEEDA